MRKFTYLASLSIGLATTTAALAQSAPAMPANDIKGLEKSADDLLKPNKKASPVLNLRDTQSAFSIALLRDVRVASPYFSTQITNYWLPSLRKEVSTEKMVDFKAWVWQKLNDEGYLGYVELGEEKSPEGSTLLVTITPLNIGRITVFTAEEGTGKKYADEIARRFGQRYSTGQPLDVADLENMLTHSAYDLPVELDVKLSQADARTADIQVNMRLIKADPGKFLGGVVQLNNYGLQSYGRAQLLGGLRWGGFTPQSVFSLSGLGSDRVGYVRAEYDAPITGTHSHWHVWGSAMASSSRQIPSLLVKNDTAEYGVGVSSLVNVSRYGTTTFYADWANRTSGDQVAEFFQTSKSVDRYLRLRVRTDSAKHLFDTYSSELSLTAGNLDLSGDASDQALDAQTYQRAGDYQKLELNGQVASTIDQQRTVTASLRWRAQVASKNLSTQNRISMGGVNGIRAYNTADGSGDEGAGFSLDLTKRISDEFYFGGLYDYGWVRLAKNPLAGTTVNTYNLQGAGVQVGGAANRFNWNVSVAKSFGDGQDTRQDSNLTQVGDWRINFEVTRAF